MPVPLIWYITAAFGLLFWSVVAAQYNWPAVSKRERAEALRPFLVLYGFGYIGMVFLVPGVVSPEIADTWFARGVAYGDLLTADAGIHRARRSQVALCRAARLAI